jgi:hypothetical protein
MMDNYYYEVTEVEDCITSTKQKFQKVKVRVYRLLIINEKKTIKIYSQNSATPTSAHSTIFIWEDLDNSFPVSIGDIIEGEIVYVSNYNTKDHFLR